MQSLPAGTDTLPATPLASQEGSSRELQDPGEVPDIDRMGRLFASPWFGSRWKQTRPGFVVGQRRLGLCLLLLAAA
jgi:hypothetical protein